jgi:predicted GIY-YIG superfamily endonuclease
MADYFVYILTNKPRGTLYVGKRCCDPTFRFDFGSVILRFDFNR